VPAKTPRPIFEKLVGAFERISKNPELLKRLDNLGLLAKYEGPAECVAFLKENREANAALIKDIGFKEAPKGH
jgi:tripartite-type tricarboxylate transporter receptor subunit TctC